MIEETTEHPLAWSIDLPSSMTVIELAAIMAGVGTPTRAYPTPTGCTLRPITAGAPKPTPQMLRDILEHGVPRLPVLVSRPDLR